MNDISKKIYKFLIENEIENKDIKVIRKDGSHFHGMILTSQILKDGEIIGERGVIIDISERIKSINELKKEKAKAERAEKMQSDLKHIKI